MTAAKILHALQKAAVTEPRNAELVSRQFMDELFEKTRSEDLAAFASGFYCASAGDDAEEKLVLGWLSEARTLKRQCAELISIPHQRGTGGLAYISRQHKYMSQYRAELRKLAERIHKAMEEHEA